jgi:nucleotide-binding universal stress UspA family protein
VVGDLERSTRKDVGLLPGSGTTTYAIEPAWGEPAARILEAASAHEGDLVVMGTESRRGLARIAHPPVASRVVRHASGIPVVFVPRPAGHLEATELPPISTILVSTDLSAAGNNAVPYAYSVLAPTGGVVELCHVHERWLPSPPYAYTRLEDKLTDAERSRLERELRALVPNEAEGLGITTHITVIDGGKAAEAILQAAERLVVDAIALGSHGRGGAYRSLLGSVSQDVVRHARRPVLVVPSPRKEA